MAEREKVITAAGVSAGIDMALTLLARQLAQGVQLAIGYDPRPSFDTSSPSKAPAEIVEFARSRLSTLAPSQEAKAYATEFQ